MDAPLRVCGSVTPVALAVPVIGAACAQVWLRSSSSSPTEAAQPAAGPPLVYACSWWNGDVFGAAMPAEDAPIWRNLAAARTEAYRDLRTVYLGDNAELEGAFGAPGPFWGRHYVLYAGGKPLTVIYEVFGPALRTWLGDGDGRGDGRPYASALSGAA